MFNPFMTEAVKGLLKTWVGIFQVEIFLVGIFQGGVWWVGIFRVEVFLIH